MLLKNDFHPLNFRQSLKAELDKRQAKNRLYSLRAFARDLELSPSFIANVMAERKSLDEETALSVAKKLKWPATKRKVFSTLVRYDHARDPEIKAEILCELDEFKNKSFRFKELETATFSIVSEWYYYAILELTQIQDFDSSAVWIAKRLNLSIDQVLLALRRLEKAKLIEKIKGVWKKCDANYSTTNEISSKSIRNFHQQILERARLAIESQSLDQRDYSCIVAPTHSDRIAEAKKKISRFRRELMEFLEEAPEKDCVYCMATQLFRLDQKNQEQ